MVVIAALVLAVALAYAVHRVTTVGVKVTVTHTGLSAPMVGAVDAWWQHALTTPEPAPAETHEPARQELDEEIDAAIGQGMEALRVLYAAKGTVPNEAELRAEAAELVLAEFGT